MKIKMLVSRTGSDGVFNPGDLLDVPADEASRMIEAGQCEVVRQVPETAIRKPKTEKAV